MSVPGVGAFGRRAGCELGRPFVLVEEAHVTFGRFNRTIGDTVELVAISCKSSDRR